MREILDDSQGYPVNELGRGEGGGERGRGRILLWRDRIKCRMLLDEALWTSVKDEERNGRQFS
ncbi:hypothetical protein [Microcoleus sp. D2_18a_B4]|uniref:hypothetical protein n=1 Tax=Microcoleus sp. D2_18a_B4 TaxID=3055329 RepID=UPI002FD4FE0B